MKGTNLPSFRFIPCQRKVARPGHRYLWMEERLYGTGMLIAALQGYPGCVQLFRSIACDSWAQVHVLCETSGEGTGWSRINHSCWSQCLQSAVINSSPRPYSNLLNGDHSLIWYHSLTKPGTGLRRKQQVAFVGVAMFGIDFYLWVISKSAISFSCMLWRLELWRAKRAI